MSNEDAEFRRLKNPVTLAVLVLFLVIVLRNAWTCDDAYITFRTIDNLVHGFGLTWNVAERAQAFTHPLWLFLLAPFYLITGNIYFTVIFVSAVISLLAAIFILMKIAPNLRAGIFGVIALTLSTSFIDYCTSGLENPLSYLLLILFLWIYFENEKSHRRLFILSLVAALAILNRLDAVIFYAPMLGYSFWEVKSWKNLRVVITGFTPVIAWELFAIFYYGFPLPNTAYAKLATQIPASDLIAQGISYLMRSLVLDPVSIVIILAALIFAVASRERKLLFLAAGILLSLLYIMRIGGCFMMGRHFTLLFLAGCMILVRFTGQFRERAFYPLTLLILVPFLLLPYAPLRFGGINLRADASVKNGILDERIGYDSYSALMNFDRTAAIWPRHPWAALGHEAREKGEATVVRNTIGVFGYFAGPRIFIMDNFGLADPLMAHLPIKAGDGWRIGHFVREIPAGYIASRNTGENLIREESVAAYYDKIKLVTQGNIFDWKRLKYIILMNIGYYDDLIENYGQPRLVQCLYEKISEPISDGTPWNDNRNIIIDSMGLAVKFDRLQYADTLEIGRDHNDLYAVKFLRQGEVIGEQEIASDFHGANGMKAIRLALPESARREGFDEVRIFPIHGDGNYSIGYLRLLDVGS